MTIVFDLRNARDPVALDSELVRIAKFFGCPSTLDAARARRDRIEGQVRTHCAMIGSSPADTETAVKAAINLWASGAASAATCVERGNRCADGLLRGNDDLPPAAA